MSIRLIINADDFGLSKSVNRAIIDVYSAGNLTSTTLMVNMPGTDNAVQLAKENPNLSIGLHFCISEGKSLSENKTLTDSTGNFFSRSELIKKIIKKQIDSTEVQNEFKLQLEKAEGFGIKISHSDSHQHLMMFPAIFKAIQPVAEERDLALRIVNPPDVSIRNAIKRPPKFIKQVMNKQFSKQIIKNFTGKTNSNLVSIHDLESIYKLDANTYLNLLLPFRNDEIVELMVHPYILDDDVLKMYSTNMKKKSDFLKKCEKEYEILSGKTIFSEYQLSSFQNIN